MNSQKRHAHSSGTHHLIKKPNIQLRKNMKMLQNKRSCLLFARCAYLYTRTARSVHATKDADSIEARKASGAQQPSRFVAISVVSSLSKPSGSFGVHRQALTPAVKCSAKPCALAASIGVPELIDSMAVKPMVSMVLADTQQSATRTDNATSSRPTNSPVQCKRFSLPCNFDNSQPLNHCRQGPIRRCLALASKHLPRIECPSRR